MKVFHFTFEGKWLSGSAVVVAKDMIHAKTILQERYSEEFAYALQIYSEHQINDKIMGVHYFDNGDY